MSWQVSSDLVSRKWVPLPQLFSFHVLTSPSWYGLQLVSAPPLATFFLCPDKSFPMWSLVCECSLLSHFLSVSWQVSSDVVSRMWVPLAQLLFFHVLTGPSQCGLQLVSALSLVTFFPCSDKSPWCGLQFVSTPCLLAFFACPDKSLSLCPPGCECPSWSFFPSVSWQVTLCVVLREWVPLASSLSFGVLTNPFLGTFQFVRAPSSSFIPPFFWFANVFPPLCACRKWKFLSYFPFFVVLIYLFSPNCSWYSTNWDRFTPMYCHYFSVLSWFY